MSRKSIQEIKEEQKVTIKNLSIAYSFLLSALVIFLYSTHNVTINFMSSNLSIMSILFPTLYFLSCVTAKELGYKYGLKSVIISTIVLFFYGAFCNFFVTGNFNIYSIGVITLSYFTTQSICLSIYNYFMLNTRLPIFVVIFNYVFCCLVYNMIYMLFNYKMAITDEFWLEYFLAVILQAILSIVLAIFDSIVERGIDE
ncbi:MAG: hypothetical protein IK997_01400 [Bacilli bacterium]|nr:hypothetical protein [Bacilli bacterium]